jgi:hypothetical protein
MSEKMTACCGAPCPPEGGRCDRCGNNASVEMECPWCMDADGAGYGLDARSAAAPALYL